MFIALEGIDGCGKSTQLELLSDWLKQANNNVIIVRDPGTTELGKQLRKILLEATNLQICPMAQLALFGAARTQTAHEVVAPALQKGTIVLADRWNLSTVVYQGYGAGKPGQVDEIWKQLRWLNAGTDPNLTILLDVDVSTSIGRTPIKEGDRFESKNKRFRRTLRNGYLVQARYWQDVVVVDGHGEPDEVQARVQTAIADYCKKNLKNKLRLLPCQHSKT